MRAREFLFERDERTTEQKLMDLINHPTTEENVRNVAVTRLAKLKAAVSPKSNDPVKAAYGSNAAQSDDRSHFQGFAEEGRPHTNLSIESRDVKHMSGRTFGQLYDALAAIQPRPSRIDFGPSGHKIKIMVPPPFLGLTKREFYELLVRACPGLSNIESQMVGNSGYVFWLTYS